MYLCSASELHDALKLLISFAFASALFFNTSLHNWVIESSDSSSRRFSEPLKLRGRCAFRSRARCSERGLSGGIEASVSLSVIGPKSLCRSPVASDDELTERRVELFDWTFRIVLIVCLDQVYLHSLSTFLFSMCKTQFLVIFKRVLILVPLLSLTLEGADSHTTLAKSTKYD